MWKEFKRTILEAAAETVDDQVEKELAVKVWGKLASQVIGEMKNGFLLETEKCVQPKLSHRGRVVARDCANERKEMLPFGQMIALQHRPIEPVGVASVSDEDSDVV